MTIHRKFFLASLLVCSFLSWPAGAGKEETDRPTRVVLFPFRRAVISSSVDASVKEYSVEEGESFAKGQVIVKLDDTLYRLEVLKAKAYATFAAEVYENNLTLAKKGGIGRHALAKSKFEHQAAGAEMKIAQINLDACVIKAPFPGRLVKRIASEHEFVRIGQPVMEIIDDYQLLAVMHLPSSQKKSLQKGQGMKFKIDETDTVHAGKVYEISAEIDPRSRTFKVKVLIDNSAKALSAGMSGIVLK